MGQTNDNLNGLSTFKPNKLYVILYVLLAGCASDGYESPESPRPLTNNNQIRAGELEPEALYRMAQSLERNGDYAGALNFYTQAAQKTPEDPRPLVGMADIYWNIGQTDRASQLYRRILTLDPDNADAATGVAENMIFLERPEAAVSFINQFIGTTAGTPALFNALGVAYDLTGNPDGAHLAYADGLDLSPGDTALLNNLALSFAIRGDYETAVGLLRKVLDGPEGDEQGRQNLALIYALSGQTDAAVEIAATMLSDEEVARNKVFYSYLPGLTPDERAKAVFLGKLPERPLDQVSERPADVGILESSTETGSVAADLPVSDMATADSDIPEDTPMPTGQAGPDEDTVDDTAEDNDVMTSAAPDSAPEPLGEAGADDASNDDSAPEEPLPAAEDLMETAEAALEVPTGAEPSGMIEYPPYWVQLGSYISEERARLGWDTLTGAHETLFEGLTGYLQTREPEEGDTIYRLLAKAFETRAEASEFCDTFKLAGVDCLVIRTEDGISSLQ